ncbi:MAG: A/G-specific adenine glycosylase [Bdellovibrionales bacterium]
MASNQTPNPIEISKHLVKWFKADERDLPWRKSKDPYLVWISEIMLQQTTTQVVRGYFKRFTEKWPTVSAVSKASQEEVNEYWAGLGYYSRARNILKAAQIVDSELNGVFPKTASELIKLPGIGPYTSRAISSICFSEKVGVVDGNVLRVHNRLLGKKINWWEKTFFTSTQEFSDSLCQIKPPNIINPALMDLGSTVCTPKKVMCSLCPLTKNCVTFKKGLQGELPLPKPRKEKEFWQYSVYKNSLGQRSLYAVNAEKINSPILKKNILPEGLFKKLNVKPKQYDFMHTITNHNIFIKFVDHPQTGPKPQKIGKTRLKQETPSSMIEKIWQHPNFYENI